MSCDKENNRKCVYRKWRHKYKNNKNRLVLTLMRQWWRYEHTGYGSMMVLSPSYSFRRLSTVSKEALTSLVPERHSMLSLAGSGPSLSDSVIWVHGPHEAVCPRPGSAPFAIILRSRPCHTDACADPSILPLLLTILPSLFFTFFLLDTFKSLITTNFLQWLSPD